MKRIVLLGAGNVAYHLALGLRESTAYRVVQVYSRQRMRADEVVSLLPGAEATDSLSEIMPDADIYLYALSDGALPAVWEAMPQTAGVWIHTAGSVALEAMQRVHGRSAVLYPLQTFSRGAELIWAEVPLFIEGSDAESLEECRALANALSPRISEASSADRGKLHLGAVLACNFTNHLIALGEEYLSVQGFEPKVLMPLIRETMRKLEHLPARVAQTGPAVRRDEATMARHLALLQDAPALQELYQRLSQSIINN